MVDALSLRVRVLHIVKLPRQNIRVVTTGAPTHDQDLTLGRARNPYSVPVEDTIPPRMRVTI